MFKYVDKTVVLSLNIINFPYIDIVSYFGKYFWLSFKNIRSLANLANVSVQLDDALYLHDVIYKIRICTMLTHLRCCLSLVYTCA